MRCIDCIARGNRNVSGVGSPGSKCFAKSALSFYYQTFSSWALGSLVFYYSSDKTMAAQELALDNYGTDDTWAILGKAGI